jgi:hypothetical protein
MHISRSDFLLLLKFANQGNSMMRKFWTDKHDGHISPDYHGSIIEFRLGQIAEDEADIGKVMQKFDKQNSRK